MIGYYVHHRGLGHLHRALAVIAEIDEPVVIFSSIPRPASFTGNWVSLALDTDIAAIDATAGGALHWAPAGSRGLSARIAAISRWIDAAHPSAFIVDVSVEVVALVRLHGVPVVTFAQPGDRADEAHTLGYRLSAAVIQPWPPGFHPMRVNASLEPFDSVGAISRLPVATGSARSPRMVAVLNGAGGRGASALDHVVRDARSQLPGITWRVLENKSSREVAEALRESAIVFAHCGQNVVAEIAASRIPAVLVPEVRPHAEQMSLASAIGASSLPAIVVDPSYPTDWPQLFDRARSLNGDDWLWWCDGRAAARVAAIVQRVAGLTTRVSLATTT